MKHDYSNFHSQYEEDKWIVNNIKNLPDEGFFIDIGAASAIFRNNTYHFERNAWEGICIDADPHWFLSDDDHKEYSAKVALEQGFFMKGEGRENIKCWDTLAGEHDMSDFHALPGGHCQSLQEYRKYSLNVAIGTEEKIVDFCVVDRHTLSHISGSSDNQIIEDRFAKMLQTQQIRQITLDSVMEKYAKGNHIDLLSIDAEGNDIDIWNTFNHEKYSVSILVIEHYHFDEKDFQNKLNLFGKYELVKRTKANYIYMISPTKAKGDLVKK